MSSVQRCIVAIARVVVALGLVASVALMGIAGFRLCQPVVQVGFETVAQIQPGMTEEEAVAIIGAPCGWYDGVWGISTGAPKGKGHRSYWRTNQGELVLNPKDPNVKTTAAFYPARSISWSLPKLMIERLTRRSQIAPSRVLLQERLLAFLVTSFLGILGTCRLLLCSSSKNALANHGGVGLLVGLVAAAASLGGAESGIIFTLLGSIGGAMQGIVIALSRTGRAERLAAVPVSVSPPAIVAAS